MRRAALCAVLAAAPLLAACAGAPPAPGTAPGTPPAAAPPAPAAPSATAQPAAADGQAAGTPAPPFTALAARFTDRALRQEKAGDLRQALESWKVVAALRPAAEEPRRRVADLGARTAAEAARRYAAGIARLEKGESDAARRELLLALAADPGHAGALEALRGRLAPHAAAHTVVAGESFAAVARRHYGDEAQGALLARVNGLDPAAAPAPGTVLVVPALAVYPPKAAAAKGAAPPPAAGGTADEGYETEPAAIAPEEAPAANAPPAAQPPAVPPPAAAPAAAPPAPAQPPPDPAAEQRRRRERAEELYTAGVRHYLDQRLDEAIRAWEQTLALNPEHPKAAKDLEKARALQQKLRDIR